MSITYMRWVEILWYYTRICQLKPNRLPKIVLEWEMSISRKGWLEDVKKIVEKLHIPTPDMSVLYDLDTVHKSLHIMSRADWWEEVPTKPKLWCFAEFKDKYSPNTIAYANLTRMQRSLLAKLSCGIFPLEVEVGKFTDAYCKDCLCKICNAGKVEDEYHFLFSCAPLHGVQSLFYVKHIENFAWFIQLSDYLKVRLLLRKERIEVFAEFLEALFHKR